MISIWSEIYRCTLPYNYYGASIYAYITTMGHKMYLFSLATKNTRFINFKNSSADVCILTSDAIYYS